MKRTGIVLILLISSIFLSCLGAKEIPNLKALVLQEKPSFEVGNVWFQKWVAGMQGGGSGMHLYMTLETNRNHVVFDSVYFRGLVAKMEVGKIGYIASFKTALNQKEDLVMDGDSNKEYGNKPPKTDNTFPFKLEDHECVLQYTEYGKTMYYKVTSVVEKQTEYYPSAPNSKEKQ
jgi:hypothetical protein